jgi:hypothetical protein
MGDMPTAANKKPTNVLMHLLEKPVVGRLSAVDIVFQLAFRGLSIVANVLSAIVGTRRSR